MKAFKLSPCLYTKSSLVIGLCIAIGLLGATVPAAAAGYTASRSGNWSDAGTWGGAGVPGSGDTVTIASSRIVTLDGGVNRSVADMTLDGGGTLARGAGETLAVTGTLQVNGGSQLQMVAGDACRYLWVQGGDGLGQWSRVTTASISNVSNYAYVSGDVVLGADMSLSEYITIGGSGGGHTGTVFMSGHSLTANDITFGWSGSGQIDRSGGTETLTVVSTLQVNEGSQLEMVAGDSCKYLWVQGGDGLGQWSRVTTASISNVSNYAYVSGDLVFGADMSLSEYITIGGSGGGHTGTVFMSGHSLTANDITFGWSGSGQIDRSGGTETLTVVSTLQVNEGSQLEMVAGDSCKYLWVQGGDGLGQWSRVTTASISNVSNYAYVAGDLVLGADMSLSEYITIGGSGWGHTGTVYMNGHSLTANDISFGWGGAGTSDGAGEMNAVNLNVNEGSIVQVKGGVVSSQIAVNSGAELIRVMQVSHQTNGLTLDGTTFTLNGTLDLAFTSEPGPGQNWAFRWVGSHRDTIQAWWDAGRLTFSGCLTIKIIEEMDGYTYVYAQYEPELLIDDMEVGEGNAGTLSASFTIRISPAGTNDVFVTCTTADGTALATADYAATNAVVMIPAGETSTTFTVEIAGDTVFENPDEIFYVNLTAASNCVVLDAQGAGKILNDDEGQSIVSIDDVSVVEGGDGSTVEATFTVTLTPASASNATVTCTTADGTAVSGVDYFTAFQFLTILPGQSKAAFTVVVNGDTTLEYPDETFYVDLTSPSGCGIADARGVGTIIGDDETITALTNSPGNWTNNAHWDYGSPQARHDVHISASQSTINNGVAVMNDGGTHVSKMLRIADGGRAGTLSVSNGCTATFTGLQAAYDNSAGSSVGALNVDASTVTFTGDGYLGNEGTGNLSVRNNATVNFGSNVFVHKSSTGRAFISIDPSSRVNMTGTAKELDFWGGGSHNLDFSGTPADGRMSVHTGTALWVGRSDSSVTTLTMSTNTTGVTFGGLYMAYNNSSGGSTGVLNINGAAPTFSGDANIGGEGIGKLLVMTNAVVNIGGSVYVCGTSSLISVDPSSQVNMTSTGKELNFWGGNSHSLDFVNTPTNGKMSVRAGTALWVGRSDSKVTTLTMSTNTTGVTFGNLYMAYNNSSGGSTGILNVNGATPSFSGDAGIGGEGIGKLFVRTNAVVNIGGSVYVCGTSSLISIDPSSQVNMTATGRELHFWGGGSHTIAFSNAPAEGKMSVRTGTILWVGRSDSTVTTLTMPAASSGVRFGSLYMAYNNNSQGSTGSLKIDGATVTFSGASYLGGEGNAGVVLTNGACLSFGSSVNGRSSAGRTTFVRGAGEFSVAGTLTDNARYVADGGTLKVSYGTLADESVSITMGDGTQVGWYAINGGRLVLPSLSITGSSVNWGEASADTTIDRVNSLRFKNWAGVSAGVLTNSVLATNHPSFNVCSLVPVGVWDVNTNGSSLKFSSVDVDFHYDDALAAVLGLTENGLRAFHWTGAIWEQLAGTLDTTSNRISATGISSLGAFAIAPRLDVENPYNATGIIASAAWVGGQLLHVGSTNADVYAYYGLADGDTNFSAWATNSLVGAKLARGTHWGQVSGLAPDSLYYFRCFATNAHLQSDWATQSVTFLTASAGGDGNLWISATDPSAAERGPDTGTFTIYRPAGATNGPLPVSYSVSGNAENGTDYLRLSGSTVIPAGASSVNVTVTPIFDDLFNETAETVTVTLATGDYVIHAVSNSANVVIDGTGSLEDYSCRMKIRTQGYTASGSITGFPVVVRLSDNIGGSGFSYAAFKSANGYDLRFASSNFSEILPYEIEKWDTNGQSVVWVRVPRVDDTNSFFWAFWGNICATNSAPACTTNGTTWDANYIGVWHMDQTNDTDSTSNRCNGTAVGAVSQSASGAIGPANNFTRSLAQRIEVADRPAFTLSGGYTMGGWIRSAVAGNVWEGVMGTYNGNGFMLHLSDSANNQPRLLVAGQWFDSGAALPDSTWKHLIVTRSGTTGRYYIDGVQVYSGPINAVSDGGTLELGGSGNGWGGRFDGLLDELTVANIGRGSNWVWACYSNQCPNSTFLWYDSTRIQNLTPSEVTPSSATLRGMLNAYGVTYDVAVYWGLADGMQDAMAWGHSNVIGTFSDVVTNLTFNTGAALTSNTQYYYTFRAWNGGTNLWAQPSEAFCSAGQPAVNNGTGAETVLGSATLHGELTTGNAADIRVYWGRTDGGQSANYENMVLLPNVQQGNFETTVAAGYGLSNYYYICFASNAYGVAWSPASTSFSMPQPQVGPSTDGMVAWYDAGYGVTSDGSGVLTWTDKSGSGHDATRASGTPTLVAGQLNGLPIVQFRNNNCYLNVAGTLFAKEHYYVFRCRPDRTTWSNYGNVFGKQGDDRNSSYLFQSAATYFHNNQYPDAVSRNGSSLVSPFNFGTINQYMVVKITVNNNNTGVTSYRIGGQSGFIADMDLAEVVIYNTSLSDADEDRVGGYLAGKYGIATTYPTVVDMAITNSTPSDVSTNSASLNGILDAAGWSFDVYAYYGTTDGGTVAANWQTNEFVGTFHNYTGSISKVVSNLARTSNYYYAFFATNLATNLWAQPSKWFKTAGMPAVNNGDGAIPFYGSATLRGNLTDGGVADIYVYWGTTDGGLTPGYEHVVKLPAVFEGAFETTVDIGYSHPNYYYVCFASNMVGTAWAPSSTNFTAFLWNPTNGGDHAGTDWIITNDTEVGGIHYNIGRFAVSNGATATLVGPYGRFAVTSATVEVYGAINGYAKGSPQQVGTGAGTDGVNWSGAGGGGYGGAGGGGASGSRAGGPAWGDPSITNEVLYPDEVGSGGGYGELSGFGGAGGGAIHLVATNGGTMVVDGTISAEGGAGTNGVDNCVGGGGSGGSIWLECGPFGGNGTLTVAGGEGGTVGAAGGGGGGGRIAVHFANTSFAGDFNVRGGLGGVGSSYLAQDGEPGSLYYPTDGCWLPALGGNHGGADWIITNDTAVGGIHYNIGRFAVSNGVTATLVEPYGRFVVTSATVEVYGVIDGNAKGSPQSIGFGEGSDGENWSGAGGGGYGGAGGAGAAGGRVGGMAWGDPSITNEVLHPDEVGSGGGYGQIYGIGGAGGGAVHLIATNGGAMVVDGTISAQGGAGTNGVDNCVGGGGSGGSIWLECGPFSGNGTLTVAGGDGAAVGAAGGGGGGGRIAVHYTNTSFAGNFSVEGGLGGVGSSYLAQDGEPGSLYYPTDGCWLPALGGDHGGADWIITNDTAVGGIHYNIGRFAVSNGATASLVAPYGRFVVTSATVEVYGAIDGNSKGSPQSIGVGEGTDGENWVGAGGGGYGGAGGAGAAGGREGGLAWGDPSITNEVLHPDEVGSGGGYGQIYGYGGAGGGAIHLIATNGGTMVVDGMISADGGAGTNGVDNCVGGGGSGGSIWLECGPFSGNGTLTVAGGDGAAVGAAGGGGGGGRIAVHYTNTSFTGNFSVEGGLGGLGSSYLAEDGEPGSLYYLTGTGWLPTLGGNHGGADWIITNDTTVGGIHYNIGRFAVSNGATATLVAPYGRFAVTSATVEVYGAINGNSKGSPQSIGPGKGTDGENWSGSGGGGYGGAGGAGSRAGGPAWGNPSVAEEVLYPDEVGSGGGYGQIYGFGGAGGGAIHLVATNGGVMLVEGTISADGGAGTNGVDNCVGGGGSGGSIWLECGPFSGNGTLTVAGGDGAVVGAASGGGGGGRVAVHCTSVTFVGLVTAKGGVGKATAFHGDKGSIYLAPVGWIPCVGGDHGGADWIITNNMTVGGAHFNIGRFVVNAGVTATICSPYGSFAVTATAVRVDGVIDCDAAGSPQNSGPGVGTVGANHNPAGGGGYGGAGGAGDSREGPPNAGGPAWGTPDIDTATRCPTNFGSGGGFGGYPPDGDGGAGGGAIQLTAYMNGRYGDVTVNGRVSVVGGNGNPGPDNSAGGGGAGGSIWITCRHFRGAGTVSAAGGDGGLNTAEGHSGGGGGGGRIAVYSTESESGLMPTVSVAGGLGNDSGGDGSAGTTYYFRLPLPDGTIMIIR